MSSPSPVLPVLYSFRRCPYAMRARLALHACGVVYEHREVVLKNKPAQLLQASPKGTVPVLCLPGEPDGPSARVIEQSLDIMLWALSQHDPCGWLPETDAALSTALGLIAHNDGPFKQQLDRYKYPNRSGLVSGTPDRDQASLWLQQLNQLLQIQNYLTGPRFGLSDAAIAPFVRQYAHTDPNWFEAQAWQALRQWLAAFEASDDFAAIMKKHPPWSDPAPLSGLAPN